ncbi:hypothetical protein [Enterococcus faecium]|uniref:hypothetical protein n=1 Tax=Enterococcus faecium TaxID=1352 RepID=UPI0024142B90|nr:hypothetical protein [Enterococcus faecium]EME8111604.1 hypothetical protein [Enterococcus faecium]MDG4588539.1 hypothetical protein [Enterococcus faecium]
MSYILREGLRMRKLDKALFDFSKAELIEFNDSGFDLLNSILDGSYQIDDDENQEFLIELLSEGIILEKK